MTGEYNITKDEIHHQLTRSKTVENAHLANEYKIEHPQEAAEKPSQLSFFEAGLLEDPLKPSAPVAEKKDPTQV